MRIKQEILEALKSHFYGGETFQVIDDLAPNDKQQLFDFCTSDEICVDNNTALPDAILLIKDKKIIAEHFEIDSSPKTRKGSNLRRTVAQNRQINYSLFKQENLIKNFVDSCNKHYRQIPRYKKEINKEFDLVADNWPIWFFVEDITPYGSDFTKTDISRNFDALIRCLNPYANIDFLFYFTKINNQSIRFVASKEQIKRYYEQRKATNSK